MSIIPKAKEVASTKTAKWGQGIQNAILMTTTAHFCLHHGARYCYLSKYDIPPSACIIAPVSSLSVLTIVLPNLFKTVYEGALVRFCFLSLSILTGFLKHVQKTQKSSSTHPFREEFRFHLSCMLFVVS